MGQCLMKARIGTDAVILDNGLKYIRISVDNKLLNRFINKVSINDECWEFNSSVNWKGYGRITICYNGVYSSIQAHRVSYIIYIGDIPSGLTVHHKCHNNRCVNPYHLELMTNDENRLEGNCWSAVNARKTHCKHGHPFDESNTYLHNRKGRSKPSRYCITCRIENGKRYKDHKIS